jgi:putative ABC transport system permease protein
MLAVALGALRARRTQALTLLVIAVLVTAGAVAAPLFVVAAGARVAVRDVAAAKPDDRLLKVHRQVDVDGGLRDVSGYFTEVREALSLPATGRVDGATVAGQLTTASGDSASPLAIRDGLCRRVRLTGACPAGPGEAALSTRTAMALGLRLGDPVPFTSSALTAPLPLRVTGLYEPLDPDSPYWHTGSVLATVSAVPPPGAPGSGSGGDRVLAPPDAAFVTEDTLLAAAPKAADITVDVEVTPDTLRATGAADLGQAIAGATGRLSTLGYELESDVPALLGRILDDQRLILLGVPAGAGELVLFGWYALVLAVGAGAGARRIDLGLVKLRGLPGRRLWALAGWQSTLPVLAGAVPGAALGWLLARALAGPVPGGPESTTALLLAAAAAAVAVLGGLFVAFAAERRSVRADVVDLLRRVPARSRARRRWFWRAELLDLAFVTLALVGVYQVHSAATGQDAGLVVLAPGLVAVAVGLLAARLLVPLAGAAGAAGLRTGRLRAAMTGTYLARRSGMDRLFALLAIAVMVAGYAALEWGAATAARHDRAAQEVGAARVLTFDPVAPGQLLAAVRDADPSGRFAMAAVETASHSGVRAVLAVDATRLASVASWTDRYGAGAAGVAGLLRPAAPAPVRVVAGTLAVRVTLTAAPPGTPVYLLADLTGPDGLPVSVRYGPLATGAQRLATPAPRCARQPGCRLDGFSLTTGFATNGVPRNPPGPGLDLTIDDLDGLDAATLREASRWRPTADPAAAGPVLSAGPDGLRVAVPASDQLANGIRREARVYLVDAPDPVPVVLAGALTDAGLAGAPGVDLFGSDLVPVRVAGRLAALPRLGRSGALVDLEYAQLVATGATSGAVPQVWLAPGAPLSIVDGLARAGLRLASTDSIAAGEARYGDSGPAVALRFQLLGAVLAVVLAAAGLVLVAAVEREPRGEELAAMRVQGMRRATARATAVGGYAWLAGAAVLTGLLVAPLDRLVTGANLPPFADDWRVLPPPGPRWPSAALLAAAVGIVLLVGAAVAVAGHNLYRALSRQSRAACRSGTRSALDGPR